MPHRLPLALVLASLVSVAALLLGSLSVGGAVLATSLGTLVFEAGGVAWSILVITFFLTSSALSQSLVEPDDVATVAEGTARRTARQVAANGLVPAAFALLELAHHEPLWLTLFAAALAASTADTWATELGARSRIQPRAILSGRPVPPGTSGGITPLGLIASLAGAGCIALVAALVAGTGGRTALIIAVSGCTGSLIDSVLGEALQEQRWCPSCQVTTEQLIHRTCLTPTVHLHGHSWCDNDRVNLLASLAGSITAAFLLAL